MRILSILRVGLLLVPGASFGATWTVPSQVGTLAAAVASAAPGDTVVIEDGVHPASSVVVPFPLHVRGLSGDPALATLDGQGTGRLLDVVSGASLTLEDLSLTGGSAAVGDPWDRTGGAVRADTSEVVARRCVFTGNQASFGGAVAVRVSDLTLEDCRFEANAASSTVWAAGGALWAKRAAGTVLRCDFLGNDASSASVPGDGGGAFLERSTLQVRECLFEGNASEAGAGALYSYSADHTHLHSCTFRLNTSGAGGALYLETSRLVGTGCVFEDNEGRNGGAVFSDRGTNSRFTGCTFSENRADPYSGGAMELWRTDLEMSACELLGNSAVQSGGAVSLRNKAVLSAADTFWFENVANVSGGALFGLADAIAVVEASTLTRNGAPSGGGFELADSASVSLDRSVVAFGTAGEAAAGSSPAAVNATSSVVWGNAAGDWSGLLAGQSTAADNVSADPLLCDVAGADPSVTTPGSPCLPGNNPGGVPIGAGKVGCGCPAGATIRVPDDEPTIAAAQAAAAPGDVIGLCSGTWTENVILASGVHLVGVPGLTTLRPDPSTFPDVLIEADGIVDSTRVADLDLDGAGLVDHVVRTDNGTTSLHLAASVVRGALLHGIANGVDSRMTVGGTLADANDLLDNAGPSPVRILNQNVAADSLNALNNYWGTTSYDQILLMTLGPVRTCPITNEQHDASLCAPLTALSAPVTPPVSGLFLSPNPFRSESRIRFEARRGVPYRLTVHDVAGRRVRTLAREPGSGAAFRTWDGRDDAGRRVAAGVYFVRLEAADEAITRKAVYLR